MSDMNMIIERIEREIDRQCGIYRSYIKELRAATNLLNSLLEAGLKVDASSVSKLRQLLERDNIPALCRELNLLTRQLVVQEFRKRGIEVLINTPEQHQVPRLDRDSLGVFSMLDDIKLLNDALSKMLSREISGSNLSESLQEYFSEAKRVATKLAELEELLVERLSGFRRLDAERIRRALISIVSNALLSSDLNEVFRDLQRIIENLSYLDRVLDDIFKWEEAGKASSSVQTLIVKSFVKRVDTICKEGAALEGKVQNLYEDRSASLKDLIKDAQQYLENAKMLYRDLREERELVLNRAKDLASRLVKEYKGVLHFTIEDPHEFVCKLDELVEEALKRAELSIVEKNLLQYLYSRGRIELRGEVLDEIAKELGLDDRSHILEAIIRLSDWGLIRAEVYVKA